MMSGFGYRLVDGADIGRRRGGSGLRMGMPVTDKVQPTPMHLVDFPLFLTSVGNVQISRATIRWPWARHAADCYKLIRKASEKLAAGLQGAGIVLLVLGEVVQD
jgi:hypothetical protein